MLVNRIKIANFRSLKELDIELAETTVFIGANNTGKTAILEAARIALSRRWGRRGTGFTELDVYRSSDDTDPKTAPFLTITLSLDEPVDAPWDADMAAAIADILALGPTGKSKISLRVTCEWDKETEAFEPAWEFLNAQDVPLGNKAQRATNLVSFFEYIPLHYLPALRDVFGEFSPRSSNWARLLRSIRIPRAVEEEVQKTLDGVDTQLLGADPKLAEIAAMIGEAATIAVGEGEGDAKLRMLPMNTWDLISRASVVLKNEAPRPWLPLDHHGQGLQSLSVIFLFQAAVLQQLKEDPPGTAPMFLLEEPESHLHPQAARTLWEHINKLPGQKLITTHSPYFVQNVPLHNLRLVTLRDGQTEIASLPRQTESELKWNKGVEALAAHQGKMFVIHQSSGNVCATSWFDAEIAEHLLGCYRGQGNEAAVAGEIQALRHRCRGLVTAQEENELSFLGRRIRGEIFFARRWILVEGQSEYVLLHAIGRALGYPLDRHGIAVIDFQNNGDADIYPALATSFNIPWQMITDGDAEAVDFKAQLIKRGFVEEELAGKLSALPAPNCLEDQLLADGHEALLRDILAQATSKTALTCAKEEFVKRLKNKKLACIGRLALRVRDDAKLAASMPAPFVGLVQSLKGKP